MDIEDQDEKKIIKEYKGEELSESESSSNDEFSENSESENSEDFENNRISNPNKKSISKNFERKMNLINTESKLKNKQCEETYYKNGNYFVKIFFFYRL